MTLLLLKDDKLLNKVVVPDSWPNCEDPWKPDPAAGITWEVDKGQQYEAYEVPQVVAPDPGFEALKQRAMEAMLDYVAKQPDAPADVLAWDKARKGG